MTEQEAEDKFLKDYFTPTGDTMYFCEVCHENLALILIGLETCRKCTRNDFF
jgi:hypothetical protein